MKMPTPPSDRARKLPVSGLGVDTIILRGPASSELIEQLPDRRFQLMCDDVTGELTDELRSGRTPVQVGNTHIRVFADYRTGKPEVGMQYSAPSVLAGHNRDPLDLSLLPFMVDAVLEEIGRHIIGMPDYEDLRPVRIDVTRDFPNVESPSRTLEQIARLPVGRGKPDRTVGGESGGLQTLMRGNTARWQIRGYGKYVQMLDLARREPWRRSMLLDAANGHEELLRVEVQLNAQFLRDRRINTVDSIEAPLMHDIAEDLFIRSRFGDVIGGTNRLREVMTQLKDARRGAEARGISTVLLADLGGYDPALSHNPAANARKLLRHYGLTVADLTGGESDPRRLDFWAGEELIGMEAIKASTSLDELGPLSR
jgi:hypothetical protein